MKQLNGNLKGNGWKCFHSALLKCYVKECYVKEWASSICNDMVSSPNYIKYKIWDVDCAPTIYNQHTYIYMHGILSYILKA